MIPAVKKTAVIYVRVSSDEQVENTSLETQETACRRWCEQGGYEVDPQWVPSQNRIGTNCLRLQAAIGAVA